MNPFPRYPIYIPTRGRYKHERRLTIRALLQDNVPFRAVVEPREAEHYRPVIGNNQLLVLPFDGNKSSTFARNWIRDHAVAEGHARHWQLDDNMRLFRRLWKGHRIPCHAGIALKVCEDFSDRYTNVGVSGLNYQMFVPPDSPVPYWKNTHVYSCTLVNHEMPYKWRLDLNEDTDLCLQALTNGWCTINLNIFMCDKIKTMAIGGGNTDDLYANTDMTEQGRLHMARLLEKNWPGLVTLKWRFGRPQHVVNWKAFTDDPKLIPKDPGALARLPKINEYGLKLHALQRIRGERLKELLAEYEARQSRTAAAQ